jgi:acetyltransferase-like isoleucine patch superfamily enzyme
MRKKILKNKIRAIFFISLAPFLGNKGRLILAKILFSGDIHWSASIGISFIDTRTLSMGKNSRIGHFTVIRNMDEIIISEFGSLGTFNWIFGDRTDNHFHYESNRRSVLFLRFGASVTSRHILDCTDSIDIGRFSTIAGFRSQILTHSIDVRANRQSCSPVRIGDYSFIGSGSIILKGSVFPFKSVLAAGSVYSGKNIDQYGIYSGVPAILTKMISEDARYMNRKNHYVD